MLIVFQSINFISFIPALLLGIFFDVYCLRVSTRLRESPIFRVNWGKLRIKYLPLEQAPYLDRVRDYDYGEESHIYAQVDSMLSDKVLQKLDYQFPSILNLDAKLRLALATFLEYMDVGAITLFLKQNTRYLKIFFVHASLLSFLHQSANVPAGVYFHHWLLPSDEIGKIFIKIMNKLRNFFSTKHEGMVEYKTEQINNSQPEFDTAVIFHQSTYYGRMFRKTHYFSKNPISRLHPSKVLNLVLDRQKPLAEENFGSEIVIQDLKRVVRRRNVMASFRFFLSKICQVRSVDEVRGVIFLTRMHCGYSAWSDAMERYPGLKNVIVDYDILFPKTLALALESRGVRTIAIQERGSTSFASIYGTIVDTYLFCGGSFTAAGKLNKSIFCRHAVNFGPWRASLLASQPSLNYLQLNYVGFADRAISEFKRVIAVLGWFTPEGDTSAGPIVNKQSSLELYRHARALAEAFPDCAIVLRLKYLSCWDEQMMNEIFSGMPNIFLSSDYSKLNVSYELCKRADVVVSVQTSLADECLFAGKKVVILDGTHNFKRICTDIYPEDFHFAFVTSQERMIDMVSRCLNGEQKVARQYQTLQRKLTGNFDFSVTDVIPVALESFLK